MIGSIAVIVGFFAPAAILVAFIPLTDNDAGPFGGYKQSGLGRELGREGLEAFQETKHVHIESELSAKQWWYPYGRS